MSNEEITWHVQDWLVAVEALASETHPDDPSPSAERRWRLIESICERCDVDPAEYVFEIDDDWGPQQATAAADSATDPDSAVSVSVEDSDAQQLAEVLAILSSRETETSRTRRAAQLGEAIGNPEQSVSDLEP